MTWSTVDIPTLTGRRALVTGATSGLGYETAAELLRHDATVLLAARNADKAAATADRLAAVTGRPRPEVVALDLADLDSVERAAKTVAEHHDQLDLLINNAGVMAPPHLATAQGYELQIGTNHLGHFALTARLLPLLQAAGEPRVVTVSSFMHKTVRGISQGDFRAASGYRKWDSYGKSKLANVLFTLELDRRARAAGSHLLSLAAHPGYASTHLQTAGPVLAGNALEARVIGGFTKLVAQSAAAGAWPSLYAATAPEVRPGAFYGPSFFEYRGAPKEVTPTRTARDPELARRLWEWTVEATGVDAF
ncbi:NADP-dependent 3-hydroxy acid dehydrogenase YdfG [Kribbella amoyensis]|uniref:NADP-dependent 3-hydroxy acid dehydrogenase YdfG n=1 Tax=Kribbella amoyensis TaxID=996641 RepID=A0A561BW33_9ACTN|nr:oxidoreductase [Kribbella amoyensis]TWD83089.1 NADP-dependent 3-hydroxy acid dehydrogenase YdfG [Kribbella amoyensis]